MDALKAQLVKNKDNLLSAGTLGGEHIGNFGTDDPKVLEIKAAAALLVNLAYDVVPEGTIRTEKQDFMRKDVCRKIKEVSMWLVQLYHERKES